MLPVSWSVDAQAGIRDPRQMFGRALGCRSCWW
jgi:cell division ATPase FtsA